MADGSSFSQNFILKDIELYPKLHPDKYELGCGSYGKVRMAKYCHTICAAKEIHYNLYNNATEEEIRRTVNKFMNECERCSTVRHPHIVQFLGVYYPSPTNDSLPLLIMEKMDYNLEKFIKEHSNNNLRLRVSIVHDVSLGLCFLHSQNPPIVHRDLHPRNVLVTANRAKISDFGMAKIIEPGSNMVHTETPGQHHFMPPEAFADQPNYGTSLDVFSLGCVILFVFSKQWPTPSEKVLQHHDGPNTGPVLLNEVDRRRKYFNALGAEIELIAVSCLCDEPQNRPAAEKVCENFEKFLDETVLPRDTGMSMPAANQQDHQVFAIGSRLSRDNPPMSMQTGHNILQESTSWNPEFMEAVSTGRYAIKWTPLPDLPTPMCHAYTAQDTKNMLIFVTGECPDDEKQHLVYVYDVNAKIWDTLPSPGQYYGIPQMIDEKLVIIGGRLSATKLRTNKVSTYDKKKRKWISHFPDLNTVRSKPGVITHLEHVIVAGGDQDSDEGDAVTLNSIEVLNWVENIHWRTISTLLPVPMFNFLPVTCSGHIFIVGYTSRDRQRRKNAYKIPITNITSLNQHRKKYEWAEITSYVCVGATLIPNYPKVLAVGGDFQSSPVGDIKLYDSTYNSWRNVGSLSFARTRVAVAKVSDTAIIVIGGCTDSNNEYTTSLKTVELGQAELLY